MRPARRSANASRWLAVALLFVSLPGVFVAAQDVPSGLPSVSALRPVDISEAATELVLAPGETRTTRVALAFGTAAVLTAEQVQGSVEIVAVVGEALGEGREARRNGAGLGASISMHVLAAGSDVRDFSVHNLSTTKPAQVLLRIGPARQATAEDRTAVAAEQAFARAEAIRAARAPSGSAAALAAYGEALALWRGLNDEGDATRALTWQALFLFVNQSDAKAALPLMEEAQKNLGKLSTVEAANCLKIAGYVHVQLGQYTEGRAAYTGALARFQQMGDRFNQEVLLDNLSRMERLQGDTDAALADAERASTLAAELGDVTRELKIRAGIGAIQLSAAHLEAAYDSYQKALVLLPQAPDAATEGYIWSDLGVLYTMLHDFDRAEGALAHAAAVWARAPNPAGEINTLDDEGELWTEEHQLTRAQAAYTRGLGLADHVSLPRDRVFLLRGLGAVALLENDLPQAALQLQQALALALELKQGDGLPEIYCLLGDLHARQHADAEAEQQYRICQTSAEAQHDVADSIRGAGSLARLELARGDLHAALALSEQALAAIETQRGSIPEQDLRTSFFSSMHAYYDLAIAILDRLAKQDDDAGYEWQAFLTAERARARALLDLTQADGALRSGPQPELTSELQATETQIRSLESRHERASLSPAASAALRGSIAQLKERHDALEKQSKASQSEAEPAPGEKAGVALATPLTLAAIQHALPPARSVLLEYWIGEQASVLWVISDRGLRSFHLAPLRVLRQDTASFRKLLLTAGSADPALSAEQRSAALNVAETRTAAQAQRLSAMLLPTGSVPRATASVLVVPDGPLLALPFAALRARGQAHAGAKLPRQCAILTEPSTSFLLQLLARQPMREGPVRIAVFAAGGSAEEGSTQAGASTTARPLDDAQALPYVASEVRSLQAIFGRENTQRVRGRAGREGSTLPIDWSGYTIAHFATHAVLNRDTMDLTGILLPGVAPAASGSMLWYTDICRMHAPLELAVLSACDTGAGEAVPGEGLVGLSQAFFSAGTGRVLGTLWPVDDQATSVFMRWFYTELRATASPATALRLAQRHMADSAEWSAPYFWAAFSLAGDWRGLPSLATASTR